MDRITESLMNELLKTLEIQSSGEAKDFEKLVNYTVVSNEYNKTFDVDSIAVGDGNDTGIDGIAIIVNGQLIESTEEIDDLLEKNNFLEVDYIFIQSKTSSKFESAEINTFIFGIQDFFSIQPRLVRNEDIKRFAEVSNYIFSKAPYLRENPNIKLYFVTTGKWTDDPNLKAVRDNAIENLEQTNLFDKVTFMLYGARDLSAAYRKTKESSSTSITFTNRITIPKINGVSQAYIGLLPFKEFLKIVADEEGKILNVFEDNVRDFQGDNNDVNGGIASTLNSIDSEIFSVLNNGITIVASTISPTGDQFTIIDYQIVNGCQTSNVLYNNRNGENIEKVSIPVKLIATTDEEVKTRITLATNNQTPIKKEQLASLTQFQRNLEQYYNSYAGDSKIYYERRSKQYNTDNNVLKSKIITVPYQIKAYAAMFLDEPHNVTSYFGAIVKKLNEGKMQIFNNDHTFSPYYTSAYAYYKLETFFRKNNIDSSFKKVRFHILMLFRLLFSNEALPPFNSKKMDNYCQKLLEILNDDIKALKAFKKCTDIIENSSFDKADKQDVKLVSKTKVLIDYAKNN
ncbi:AIPR family protein [Olivibacter domesticus]|uniref:AIPR protein n=1 Tax=Olivibacter domesticus TaxID=407022 RepID=A0A1H7WP09_OLID1|nr:AIPR family protein [Olivibacter domesticus]SEM23223.1 AIPR protein [Olivibacter domesticus]